MTSIAHEEQAIAEAGAWLARLQRGDVGEADGLEFDAWLDAAPQNRAAYKKSLAVWQAFEVSAEQVAAELAAASRRAPMRSAPTRRWMVAGGGLAVAAALAVTVLPGLLAQPETQTYVTGKGQHQRVALADGSVVDLNAESRLSVTLARSERRVVLDDGEAIFDVAHDARRPFNVAAANHVVRVVGTQFDVRNRQGELTVTVARGKVQVRPVAAAAAWRAYSLTAGQRMEVAQNGAVALRTVDPQETFSWRVGRLVYREQPLAEVVADLNRQFVEQIEIGDPALGEIPITGVIILDDPKSVMSRLSLMLPVRTVPSDRGLLLLRK
ncbi:FecR domain-containing protein [uncultured Phenylobacterium sp.]|uniref:FecR family protein n=1 Tax=uncultured Phenylobacterium sp. TaxID=349273 RepID=UPI0025D9E84E|nr:FecR domain-containing protein [uncultured Phenylobacterium sp.]